MPAKASKRATSKSSKKGSKKGSKKASKKGSKKASKKVSLRKGGHLTWIGFVLKESKDKGISYGDALAKSKKAWTAYKREHGID